MASLNTLHSYGSGFQIKAISALLTDKLFLQSIIDVLSDENFDNQGHKWIIGEIVKYYEKYNCNISMEYLNIELKKLENEVLKISIKEQLKAAYEASEEDLRFVESEFSNFLKNQSLKKALLNSVDLLKAGDYDSIRGLVNKALQAGQSKDIGMDYKKEIEWRYRDDNRNPIPFPWPTFNKITQGGYGKGDLVLIFGNPKGGKSWVVAAMAAEAARLGYKVVLYALELGAEYVGKRLDSILTETPVDQIQKHKDKVEQAMENLPGQIIVKRYSPKRASLATIESHLNQLKDQYDFVPDVIFIDYLDLLKTRTARKERKEEIDDVYTDAKGLAVELNIPIVSPSQANRSGAEKEILESTHIAGSFDKIMIGDIIISLARGRMDRLNGTGRFHFMGNRYGVDGVTFGCKIDTSMGKIEVDEDEMDINSEPENQPIEKKKGEVFNKNEKNFLKKQFDLLERS